MFIVVVLWAVFVIGIIVFINTSTPHEVATLTEDSYTKAQGLMDTAKLKDSIIEHQAKQIKILENKLHKVTKDLLKVKSVV